MGVCAGIVTGLLVGVILVILLLKVTKTDGSIKCKYDERQSADRGKGYKYGFFTFMFGNFLYAVACAAEVKLPLDEGAAMVLIIVTAVVVHISYCIWKDAYFSLNENRGRLMAAFAVISALNLFLGIRSILEGYGMKDGILTFNATNLLCGLMFVIIFLVMVAKHISEKTAGEE